VNRIERLAESYGRFIAVPWQDNAAPAQRVIFCIYDPKDELHLRAKIDEFEIATQQAGHGWALFDLTDTFADWLKAQRYAESYFEKPNLLSSLLDKYLDYITDKFQAFLATADTGEDAVLAVNGVGSLFGLIKVKGVVDKLAPLVSGRLVIFFPGTYENNNYRLLDGYDGWNYLAVPIAADRQL
jgi:hypothetical protein